MAINYEALDTIEVYSQIELDAVPDDFRGQVIVCSKDPIVIDRKFEQKVLVTGPIHAVVKNDAVVDALGKSFIYVKAKDNSKAIVTGIVCVIAEDNSFISAFDEAKVEQIGNATVWAYEESSIAPEDKSKITVLEPDTVTVYQPGILITLYNLWRVTVRQNITKTAVFRNEE